jgi:hypothetical protein
MKDKTNWEKIEKRVRKLASVPPQFFNEDDFVAYVFYLLRQQKHDYEILVNTILEEKKKQRQEIIKEFCESLPKKHPYFKTAQSSNFTIDEINNLAQDFIKHLK